MADTETPYSSAWWLERLGKVLDSRASSIGRYRAYYEGRHRVAAFAGTSFSKAFAATFQAWSDNFCALIVQAVEERLTIQGFQFGNDRANKAAWALWQANEMDAQSQRAHREALIAADCPVIIEPADEGARIRIQRPEEVVIAYRDDPLVREVAMRRWKDATGQQLATLYYADRIEKYSWWDGRAPAGQFAGKAHWRPRDIPGESWVVEHDLEAVPVVAIVNDPSLGQDPLLGAVGRSELADILPLQDALNKLYMDLLVANENGAFRQRWATGIEIPTDPETNKPLEPFKAAVDRIWSTEVVDAKFGDFEQTQLAGTISAIETTVQHMASTSRTPPHYLLGQMGSFPSGEALRSVETGLVAKAKRRQRDYGEAWEEIMRLAFRAAGKQTQGQYKAAETNWADPENRTESQHVDALTKLSSIGVPDEQLWEDAGYTPEQISSFRTMQSRPAATVDAAIGRVVAAAIPPPVPETAPAESVPAVRTRT